MTGRSPSPHRWGARARITLVVTLAFTLAAAVLSILFVNVLRSQLVGNIDQANDRRARDIAALLDSEDDTNNLQLPSSHGDSDIAQVISADGNVIAASTNLGSDAALPFDTDEPVTVDDLTVGQQTARYRLAAMTQIGPDSTRTVVVGRSLERLDETLGAITLALVIDVPTLAVLVAALTWTAVARSLRPVEAIREEFSRITASDLHRRVPHPRTNDEVGALADTLNSTLVLLEREVKLQQRFVADAAHELRSPLAALTAQLEVAHATAPADQSDTDTTLTTVLGQARRIEQLIDDLLLLARRDAAPDAAPPSRLVDLDEVVLDEALRARLTSDVPIDTAGVSSGQVRGAGGDLQRVVRNLLDNAVRHASTRVAVIVHEGPAVVVLHVDDDGPGIAPADRERVFERFTRLDNTRDRRTGGTGLGLAISAEIVHHHRGSIVASESPQGGARFTVELPAASPSVTAVPDGQPAPPASVTP